MGRPSLKTPELIAELLERLVTNDSGLEGVCRDDDMPALRTVFTWLREDESFRQQYAHAREAAGEVQAFRAMAVAIKAADPTSARLEYDARKWAASKLNGKWYGEKTILAGDKENPIEQRITKVLDATRLSEAALREVVALGDADAS